MCAKLDKFLSVRAHFDTKRAVNFVHIATFPSPTFGPLFAFHCPLFFTKNNNLECRDVLKTVTVTSDQKRFGPYTAHNKHKWSSGFMVLDVSYSRVLGQRPTFYWPLYFFYEKQAIRRRQFAAIDCDVFMCGSYRIAGSELPRCLGAYVSPYNNTTTGRWSHRCGNGPSLFKQIPTFSFIVDR